MRPASSPRGPAAATQLTTGSGTTAVAAVRSAVRARWTSWRTAPVGEPELARHLVLAAPLDGDRQQRVALALGQRREPLEGLAHDGPPLELVLGGVGDPQRLLQLVVVVARLAQQVEGRVVRDPVQPRAQVAHLVAALEPRQAATSACWSASSARASGSTRLHERSSWRR